MHYIRPFKNLVSSEKVVMKVINIGVELFSLNLIGLYGVASRLAFSVEFLFFISSG
jgi:hypothetical protein